jgi:hypothetical protein
MTSTITQTTTATQPTLTNNASSKDTPSEQSIIKEGILPSPPSSPKRDSPHKTMLSNVEEDVIRSLFSSTSAANNFMSGYGHVPNITRAVHNIGTTLTTNTQINSPYQQKAQEETIYSQSPENHQEETTQTNANTNILPAQQ